MALALSNPSVRVNGQTIAIVPNSLVAVPGDGETSVRAASGGGDSISTVTTVNAESKIGKVMFDIYNTADALDNIATWKSQPDANVVQIVDGSLRYNMQSASMTNDPEQNLSADGVTSIEFHGAPIQRG